MEVAYMGARCLHVLRHVRRVYYGVDFGPTCSSETVYSFSQHYKNRFKACVEAVFLYALFHGYVKL